MAIGDVILRRLVVILPLGDSVLGTIGVVMLTTSGGSDEVPLVCGVVISAGGDTVGADVTTDTEK